MTLLLYAQLEIRHKPNLVYEKLFKISEITPDLKIYDYSLSVFYQIQFKSRMYSKTPLSGREINTGWPKKNPNHS